MTSENYFGAEYIQLIIGAVAGLVFILSGLYFYFGMKTPFYSGLSIPFIVIPLFLFIICVALLFRTPVDLKRVNGFIQEQPEQIFTVEIPRMEKVITGFKTIKIAEIILAVCGTILFFIFRSKSEFAYGIGVGLAIQSAVMWIFDHIAHLRAEKYLEFLNGL